MFPSCSEALTKLQKTYPSLNEVKAAFRKFDSDGDGHITKQELSGVMRGCSATEVEAVFALGDRDQSGGIDYQVGFTDSIDTYSPQISMNFNESSLLCSSLTFFHKSPFKKRNCFGVS